MEAIDNGKETENDIGRRAATRFSINIFRGTHGT
jgi:hypothetical protein